MSDREDFREILRLVRPGARALDIGCGEGALLELLAREKNIDGRGLEISQSNVSAALARGLDRAAFARAQAPHWQCGPYARRNALAMVLVAPTGRLPAAASRALFSRLQHPTSAPPSHDCTPLPATTARALL